MQWKEVGCNPFKEETNNLPQDRVSRGSLIAKHLLYAAPIN